MITTVASGLLLFFVPGALLLRASGAELPRAELPAWAFAASLAVLFFCFAGVAGLGLPLHAALWPLVATIAAAAGVVGTRTAAAKHNRAPVTCQAPSAQHDGEPRWWPWLLVTLLVAAAFAAANFASVGSIDRWWYLAYVRGYLQSDALRITEPFLGTERVFARFGVHPWLMGLALWSQVSGADPVWLYERVAPVFSVVAAVSATIALASALFGRSPAARAAVLATLLSWSGGLLPVLARAGEDKVLAQAALAGLCLAACLNSVRGRRGGLAMAALAAIATATVHALVFALVLAAWLPFALLRGLRVARERRPLAAATLVLLVVAVQPAVTGLLVERNLVEAGAVARSDDHPVLRVHESRDRTVDAGRLGFVVNPRLIAHPMSLLVLAAIPLLLRRRRSLACDFLLVSTATALLIAFVPPLPALAGKVIPDWMVYRVLWIIPLGPLAALGVRQLAGRLEFGEAATVGLLFALVAFPLAWSIEQRVGETRARRALPSSAEFSAAVQAVAELPRDALVAAAPQLAERLPALTGRHVVAALDRSTIVFSGSRDVGEARLRLRAAILTGDQRAGDFASELSLRPTHALFDPRAAAQPSCAQRVFSGTDYALCSLAEPTAPAVTASLERAGEESGAAPSSGYAGGEAARRISTHGGTRAAQQISTHGGTRAAQQISTHGGTRTAQQISTHGASTDRCATSCTPAAHGELVAASQPGDWDAAPPLVDCRIECRSAAGAAPASIDAVELVPLVGRAVDELLLRARGFRRGREVYVADGRARTAGSTPIRFVLPHAAATGDAADTVELRITSGLLPFVKLRDVTWSVGEDSGAVSR